MPVTQTKQVTITLEAIESDSYLSKAYSALWYIKNNLELEIDELERFIAAYNPKTCTKSAQLIALERAGETAKALRILTDLKDAMTAANQLPKQY